MARSSSPTESINPYVEILQLDPEDCPPDHYALLGLERFASEKSQIEAAATEQIRYVRPFCARYPTEGTQLLNELTKAKLCLLNDEDRATYDAQLRLGEGATETPPEANAFGEDSDSFASAFGDELDAMSESKADTRTRRCPHCGSGLFDDETTCQSCTSGLAAGGPWMIAKCPDCQKSLIRGAVVCKMCKSDLSITDVIGCIPSHVPGSIRPFECLQRKKMRAARQQAMLAWKQEATAKPAADSDAKAATSPERKAKAGSPERKAKADPPRRRPVEDSLPTVASLVRKAINTAGKKLGFEDNIADHVADTVASGYSRIATGSRATKSRISKHRVQPGTVAAYAGMAAIPLVGLVIIFKLISSSSATSSAELSNVAAAETISVDAVADSAAGVSVLASQDTDNESSDAGDEDAPTEAREMAKTKRSAPSDPSTDPASVKAQQHLEGLTIEVSNFLSSGDINSIAGIRDALKLLQDAKALEASFINDSERFGQLDRVRQELLDRTTDELRSQLNVLRSQRRDSPLPYHSALALLNDPIVLPLKDSGRWSRTHSAAFEFVSDEANRILKELCDAGEFDEATKHVRTAESPLVIAESTPYLRSLLEKHISEYVSTYGNQVWSKAIQLGSELKIAEGLQELNKLAGEPVSQQLATDNEQYFNAFLEAVTRKMRVTSNNVDSEDLRAVIKAAEPYDTRRNASYIAQIKAHLAHAETLAKVKTVKSKRDAEQLLDTPSERDELDEVVRFLNILRSDSGVRRDSWYVVSLGATRQFEKFDHLYQAAVAVVLNQSKLDSTTFSGVVVSTEDEADAILSGSPTRAIEMRSFRYPTRRRK